MPTDFEFDDFVNEKLTYDELNCNGLFKDDLGMGMDYVYDEELFENITNEIETPLFDSDKILLHDVTSNDIWNERSIEFRRTQQESDGEYNNNLSSRTAENETQSFTLDRCNGININDTRYSSVSGSSHSPTPSLSSSSDSCSINDINHHHHLNNNNNMNSNGYAINANAIKLNQSILINNNNNNQLCTLNTSLHNNYTTSSSSTIKIPINVTHKHAHPVNGNGKCNVIYPKSIIKPIIDNRRSTSTIIINNSQHGEHVDPKIVKRMQRMIKNRESACMSRKRKKEYVISLEKQCEQLSNENRKLRMENNSLKQIVAGLQMNCKSESRTTIFSLSNISNKNTAILLGMLLMVSINIGSFRNLLFKDIANENFKTLTTNDHIDLNDFHTRRHLLNIENNNELVSSSNEMEMEVEVVNNSNPIDDTFNKSTTYFNSSCPLSINQTENIRLASELRKFIGDNTFYNITHIYQRRNFNSRLRDYEFKRNNARYAAYENKMKIKLNKLYSLSRRNRRIGGHVDDMQVYSFGPHLDYTRFLQHMHLRDDTFYVISFRGNHILIPAINHNKTSKPKMSFLMPAINHNDNRDIHKNESFSTPHNHVTLVKIDCEVINTNLVHVNENSIPQHLRASFLQNQTQYSPTADTTANLTITRKAKAKHRLYKPYFIRADDNLDLKNFGSFL